MSKFHHILFREVSHIYLLLHLNNSFADWIRLNWTLDIESVRIIDSFMLLECLFGFPMRFYFPYSFKHFIDYIILNIVKTPFFSPRLINYGAFFRIFILLLDILSLIFFYILLKITTRKSYTTKISEPAPKNIKYKLITYNFHPY